MADLTFITGPMFAGKSTLALRKLKYLLHHRKKIMLFKPWIDNRSSHNYVNCHNLIHFRAIPIKTAQESLKVLDKCKIQPDFVFFDEINFFSLDLIEVIKTLRKKGIHIVCSGLNKDFRNRTFSVSDQLLKSATKIIYRFAGCHRCFRKADCSQRLVKNDNVILVGGADLYAPSCTACHI